eukprot:2138080-Prymnesium_polylepis.2
MSDGERCLRCRSRLSQVLARAFVVRVYLVEAAAISADQSRCERRAVAAHHRLVASARASSRHVKCEEV